MRLNPTQFEENRGIILVRMARPTRPQAIGLARRTPGRQDLFGGASGSGAFRLGRDGGPGIVLLGAGGLQRQCRSGFCHQSEPGDSAGGSEDRKNRHPPLDFSVSAGKTAKASGAVSYRLPGSGAGQVAGRRGNDRATAFVAPVCSGTVEPSAGSIVWMKALERIRLI